jgi:nitrate reductase delta subunit
MSTGIAAWDAVADLFEYPEGTYSDRVAACAARLDALGWPAAGPLARLRDAIAARPLASVQEEYAAAFDFEPATALEVGWHLFHDGPDRGPWLAALAEALSRAQVPRREELPDHLAHLLMLVARAEAPQGPVLADLILPAVRDVQERLMNRGSPFTGLVEAAGDLLDGCVDTVRSTRD